MAHQAGEYLAAGMDAVVVKPIDVKALLETIDRVTEVNEDRVPLARSA
jgi:hypothetical protein